MKVFLLVGQSNMAGRGRVAAVPRLWDPRVLMYRDSRWVVAEDPMHDDKPEIAGVGPGLSFAARLLRRDPGAAPLGLIPAAVGGTPLSRWVPGADLFERAAGLAEAALEESAELCGILWHQGEADAQDAGLARSYGERFRLMAEGLRSRLNAPEAPVLAGGLGEFLAKNESFPHFAEINSQLSGLAGALPHYGYVSPEGLVAQDDLHFDAASMREFGIRYAARYFELGG